MSNEMKMSIAMTFLSLLLLVGIAHAVPVTFDIPAAAFPKAQLAVDQCNSEVGEALTPKQWIAREVKRQLKECFIRIQPPDTSEFDATWPDEQ